MNIFRKKGLKIFFAIFVSFFMGVFGFGLFNAWNNPTTLAEVGSKKIKIQDYISSYEEALRSNNPQTERERDILKIRTLNQLIGFSVIIQEAKNAGLSVSDAEISDFIKTSSTFTSEEGVFNLSAYKEFLQNNSYTASSYEERLRRSILYNKYIALFYPVAKVPEKTQQYFQSWYTRRANIRYFLVPNTAWEKETTPSGAQIEKFYQTEIDSYREPTFFNVDLFFLSKEKIRQEIKKKDIENYLAGRKEEFTQKASFKSSHILFSLENEANQSELKKKADEVYQKLLKNKKQFSLLAKQYSDDPISQQEGGSLGWVEYGSFVEEFEDTIKSLKIGEISKPFLSPFGYHIVYLEDKREESFNEVSAKETVRERLFRKKWDNFLLLIQDKINGSIPSNSTQGEYFRSIAQEYNIIYEEGFLLTEKTLYEETDLKAVYNDLQNLPKDAPENYINNYEEEKFSIIYKLNSKNIGKKIPFNKIKQEVEKDFLAGEFSKFINTQVQTYNSQHQSKEQFESAAKNWKVKEMSNISFDYWQYIDKKEDNLSYLLKENTFRLKKK